MGIPRKVFISGFQQLPTQTLKGEVAENQTPFRVWGKD